MMASEGADQGLILSQQEAEEWREMHLKGYDTRLWSLEHNNGRSPTNEDQYSNSNYEVDSIDGGSLRSVSPFSIRPPSIIERRISQSGSPTTEQLVQEKEKLDRLIKIREYQLSQYQSSNCISLPSKKDLLAEKRHLSRLKFDRELQLKKKAHEEWRRMNVKKRPQNQAIGRMHSSDDGFKYEPLKMLDESDADSCQRMKQIDHNERRTVVPQVTFETSNKSVMKGCYSEGNLVSSQYDEEFNPQLVSVNRSHLSPYHMTQSDQSLQQKMDNEQFFFKLESSEYSASDSDGTGDGEGDQDEILYVLVSQEKHQVLHQFFIPACTVYFE